VKFSGVVVVIEAFGSYFGGTTALVIDSEVVVVFVVDVLFVVVVEVVVVDVVVDVVDELLSL